MTGAASDEGPLAEIPTLDEVADQPDLLRGLPREVTFQLHLKAQSVATTCALALVGALESTSRVDPEHDTLVNAREAARLLGRSVSWVQQRAHSAPLKFCLVE